MGRSGELVTNMSGEATYVSLDKRSGDRQRIQKWI